MQTIYLDIANRGVFPTIHAKQFDVGRKFLVVLTDAGVTYSPPAGSVFSVWYDGDSGEGNYTDIGEKTAFSINENKVEVELITQMLGVPGEGVLCLVLNGADGTQIASWNIDYLVESVPGANSEQAKQYYTAFSKAVADLPYPDASLTAAGKAADAAAVGVALASKAPAGNYIEILNLTVPGASYQSVIDNWGYLTKGRPFIIYFLGTTYPYSGAAFGYKYGEDYGGFIFMHYGNSSVGGTRQFINYYNYTPYVSEI